MLVPFSKYSGCGNDFILIDNRLNILEKQLTIPLIARLCHRHQGIGADGLILLENSLKANFGMRIFNADGGQAEMCGNGARCLARFINDLQLANQRFSIQAMHQYLEVGIRGTQVSINMPPPTLINDAIDLKLDKNTLRIHFLDTGVPHVVHFVEHLENDELMLMAPNIRFHKAFQPAGTNVNFAKLMPDGSISVRTYERGVEAETQACGTGAVAVAVTAAKIYDLPSPVTICTRSQELLQISFESEFKNLVMSGPAVKIYQGQIAL